MARRTHLDGAEVVEEEHAGQCAAGAALRLAEVLGDAELVGGQGFVGEVRVRGGHHLQGGDRVPCMLNDEKG
mgnify:CR=1 FL=1